MKLNLTDDIKNENGQIIAKVSTMINGDGKVPLVQTVGVGSGIVGYRNDGTPIFEDNEELINNKNKEFTIKAVELQKLLIQNNSLDN